MIYWAYYVLYLMFLIVLMSALCFLQPLELFASQQNFNLPFCCSLDIKESDSLQKIRIKDIVNFQGIRENMLMGYGIIVGLNATGDNLKNSDFTKRELDKTLGKLGVNSIGSNIKTQSVAGVTVTAKIPTFARKGSTLDVKVSTLGDAKSILGGVLLPTPMFAADGKVYAVAQGDVSLKDEKQKRHTKTSSLIQDGAIVEREIDFILNDMDRLQLVLNNPDVSTASRIATIINDNILTGIAVPGDPATVNISIPNNYKGNIMSLLNKIELLEVTPDNTAKIMINESTGSVIIDGNVKISKVSISHAGISITVDGIVENGNDSNAIQSLIDGLNAIGTSTTDMINILFSIKNSGALQGKIMVYNG